MFSITAWLTATLPAFAESHGKPSGQRFSAHAQPVPNPCPPSLPMASRSGRQADIDNPDFIGNNAHNNALATIAKTTTQPLPGGFPTYAKSVPAQADTVAVRLASSDGQRLRIIADVSRSAPRNFEDAGEQFVELMRDAVSRGYMPASVPFAGLRRFYNAIASEFEWPAISDVRLSKVLERNGCTKTVKRDRRDGKDKRTVAYLLE